MSTQVNVYLKVLCISTQTVSQLGECISFKDYHKGTLKTTTKPNTKTITKMNTKTTTRTNMKTFKKRHTSIMGQTIFFNNCYANVFFKDSSNHLNWKQYAVYEVPPKWLFFLLLLHLLNNVYCSTIVWTKWSISFRTLESPRAPQTLWSHQNCLKHNIWGLLISSPPVDVWHY